MNKLEKTDYLIKGLTTDFNKKRTQKLLNQICGLTFKKLRLTKNITAEAVVEDNKKTFNSIYDLYKFEKGQKIDLWKVVELTRYYDCDFPFIKK